MRESKKLGVQFCNGQVSHRRSLSSLSLQNFICKTRDRPQPNPTGCGNSRRKPLAAISRHENMSETNGMKNPSKAFKVFEFEDEEVLDKWTIKKISPEVRCHRALNAESYAEKTPELSPVPCNDFVSHGQVTDVKDVESGILLSNVDYSSSPGTALQLEDHNEFRVSSCNVKSNFLASNDVSSMAEGSPCDISNSNASSDGPSSDNCFGGGDLDDVREGIVFYADYLDYRGSKYVDHVVCFSRGYIEARSRITDGDEETFHIQMEIEDILKIESHWSARFGAGMITVHFIAKDPAEVVFDVVNNASVSGVQELKFPVFESHWYQKREAIELLDFRYKALWNVLFDTEMDLSLRERDDWMHSRSYFPKFDRPFEEVIYPKGDPDAVSISKRDAALLLPDTFVNDTIIDFYIKFLKTRLNMDMKTKFHFFNSFFFRKLADMDKDPSSAFDGKAAFQRVRKWTRKVNLLEKDFIFIPVNYNLHWSLIVICYFGEVADYEDGDGDGKSGRVPCILHMDSLRGTHSGLKDLMQSYLWEEWKERQKGTHEDLYSKFKNLKFVALELPQQRNSYDCGLFLLHYVELFLEEVPANFSIYTITSSYKFLQEDWFPPDEPSIKRTRIEKMISVLLDSKSEECPLLPSGGGGMHCSHEDLNTTHGFEDDIQFTIKSGPFSDSHESSLCQVGQGIEMTLLPSASARSTQCTRTSGLVLKELLSAPDAFTDAHWGAGGSKASTFELKTPARRTEGEVVANQCFVTTELAQHVFQDEDGVTPEAPTFPYPSEEDYRPEAVYRPTADYAGSTPVTSDCDSGALLTAEESQGIVDLSASEEAEVVCTPAFASDDELNVVECESRHQMAGSNDEIDPHVVPLNFSPGLQEQGNGGVEHEWVSESEDEQHAAKRMRISSPIDDWEEPNYNLAHDLNL